MLPEQYWNDWMVWQFKSAIPNHVVNLSNSEIDGLFRNCVGYTNKDINDQDVALRWISDKTITPVNEWIKAHKINTSFRYDPNDFYLHPDRCKALHEELSSYNILHIQELESDGEVFVIEQGEKLPGKSEWCIHCGGEPNLWLRFGEAYCSYDCADAHYGWSFGYVDVQRFHVVHNEATVNRLNDLVKLLTDNSELKLTINISQHAHRLYVISNLQDIDNEVVVDLLPGWENTLRDRVEILPYFCHRNFTEDQRKRYLRLINKPAEEMAEMLYHRMYLDTPEKKRKKFVEGYNWADELLERILSREPLQDEDVQMIAMFPGGTYYKFKTTGNFEHKLVKELNQAIEKGSKQWT